MTQLLDDLRFTLRSLLRERTVLLFSVATLAIALAAAISVFSVLHAVLLAPLPYPEPDRLVRLGELSPDGRERGRQAAFSLGLVREFSERSASFASLGAYRSDDVTLNEFELPERVREARVTGGFFQTVGVPPALGRAFDTGDIDAGAGQLVVLSHDFWSQRLGADPEILDQPLRVDGELRTVIGVMPEGFDFPDRAIAFWAPLVWNPGNDPTRQIEMSLPVLGRLAADVTEQQALQEGQTLLSALNEERRQRFEAAIAAREAEQPTAGEAPEGERRRRPGGQAESDGSPEFTLTGMQQQANERVTPALRLLGGAVTLLLLIACANVASLLMARGLGRRREFSTRAALGAGTGRLTRLLVAEILLIGIGGAALGLLLATAALRALVAIDPGNIPRLAEVGLNLPVLAFALAITLVSTLLFGLVPVLQVRSPHLTALLGREERPTLGGRSWHAIGRNGLVCAEMALALVLLIGAGLLTNSFLRLTSVDPGYQPEDVLTAQVPVPFSSYPPGEARTTFFDDYLRRVRAIPGVESAGWANVLPLFPARIMLSAQVVGVEEAADPEDEPLGNLRLISEGYLETMNIPLLEGRRFTEDDRAGGTPVVIVNRTFAQRFLPEGRWIGSQLAQFGEVVGVVGDVKLRNLEDPVEPSFYLPTSQTPQMLARIFDRQALVVKTPTPEPVSQALRQQLFEMDPTIPLDQVRSMDSLLGDEVARPRFFASMLSFFSAVAALLAAVGIYSVLSFTVRQATRETGIRMALGATRREVLGRALRRALAISGVGIAGGLVLTWFSRRLLDSLLFDVSTSDPTTYVTLCIALTLIALVAALGPARRAAQTAPTDALRME